jgi:transposase
MPTVNNQAMSLALENWMKDLPKSEDKIVVLLVDRAGWHMSKKLQVPNNVILYPLPPYTPELQPVETSWPLFREALANRFFKQIDDLIDCLIQRCRWISHHPEQPRARCSWQWLIHAENPVQSF